MFLLTQHIAAIACKAVARLADCAGQVTLHDRLVDSWRHSANNRENDKIVLHLSVREKERMLSTCMHSIDSCREMQQTETGCKYASVCCCEAVWRTAHNYQIFAS